MAQEAIRDGRTKERRKKMRSLKYLGYVAVSIFVTLTLISTIAEAQQKIKPVKIGVLLEYTGPAAGIGELLEDGVKTRLDEVGFKVAGRPIELIKEDTASTVNVSVDKARKLVEVDKVDVVLGPLVSDSGFAVAALLDRQGIPNIAFLDHEKDILKYKTIVLPYGTLEGHAVGFGRYAAEKLGYKNVAVVFPDYVGGRITTESFERGIKEKGGTVNKVPFPFDTVDFVPIITALKKPDAVGFLGEPTHFLRFISQYQESGLKGVPLLLMWGESLEPIAPKLGDMVVGKIGSVYWTSSIDTDISKKFVAAYSSKHGGRPPLSFTLAGYIATSVFLQAVNSTKGDTKPDKLIKALKDLKLDTPKGPIVIKERSGTDIMYIVRVTKEGGQYVWKVLDSYSSP